MENPKRRSDIRIFLGKKFYCSQRYLLWLSHRFQYAKKENDMQLKYVCMNHQTPLLRQLKDVDMHLQYNKIENLKLAVPKINNVVIHPGETFSYWRLIGKPTKRKGYKPGMVLFCGHFKEGTGGGLCQLSNLIYWMALHTPLTITERYRHSYDVFPDSNRKLPFGSGATCVYNYRDLMITNETSQSFQLQVYMDDFFLYGCIRCEHELSEHYEVYEKSHWFERELFGKYSRNNVICRKVYDQFGEETADEFITENHALMMYEPYLKQNHE